MIDVMTPSVHLSNINKIARRLSGLLLHNHLSTFLWKTFFVENFFCRKTRAKIRQTHGLDFTLFLKRSFKVLILFVFYFAYAQ